LRFRKSRDDFQKRAVFFRNDQWLVLSQPQGPRRGEEDGIQECQIEAFLIAAGRRVLSESDDESRACPA